MNKSKPNTEYKIAVDSELSDEELQPRIISRKQKKERKQRIITSLSSTTTSEELAFPIQYYFNPELYLNFLNKDANYIYQRIFANIYMFHNHLEYPNKYNYQPQKPLLAIPFLYFDL